MKRYWHGLNRTTSALGFGCWQIAGNHTVDGRPHGWGDISDQDAIRLLEQAIRSGIDFFDTAQSYNNGRSETLLGKAVSNTKTNPVICTKIVLSDHEIQTSKPDDDFEDRLNTSLKRLNRERVDVLLIHNPPDNLDWNTFDLSLLTKLQQKGKVGVYGVSSRGLSGAKRFIMAAKGSVLEWTFNIFERRPVKELFPLLEKHKVNFIARSPLSRGLINPRYLSSPPKFASDDFRSALPGDWVQWTLQSLKAFHENGVAPEQIVEQAIRYCLSFSGVTACILGIRTPSQLEAVSALIHNGNTDSNFNPKLLQGIPVCFPKWA